ncbi:helix-turn-helix transcriptional regulator [Leptolyngbya sp. FACHB-261]|uniref:ArsR/SmtB family transcription factor n=1 Tax=Leptolyngbya sp. FACHB-261 TaxID=2692806 RepID=UPI001684CD4F|nr:metalloregulator ArsR/SmtB family transcription factor [Leptolyngbya sp. FACHB-261]MBD2099437.1 winged helix-turn-helix transcriptional regulator [Leptolyngbya sp. FACHB-261]
MPSRVLENLADLFSALSHPNRIRIVQALATAERDVTELHSSLELSQSYVSQQLSVLKNSGLVKVRREGHHAYYSLRHDGLPKLIDQGLDLVEEDIARARELEKVIGAVRNH